MQNSNPQSLHLNGNDFCSLSSNEDMSAWSKMRHNTFLNLHNVLSYVDTCPYFSLHRSKNFDINYSIHVCIRSDRWFSVSVFIEADWDGLCDGWIVGKSEEGCDGCKLGASDGSSGSWMGKSKASRTADHWAFFLVWMLEEKWASKSEENLGTWKETQ